LNPDIWAAPIDAGAAVLQGELQPVTREKYWESRPSVSPDESTFVFRTDRGGGWDFWSLDLRSSQARPVTISRTVKVFAALSRDNKSIAWHDGRTVHAADLQTGTTRRLCADCAAQPSDWTGSGDVLVTLPASDAIGLMSPRDGAIRVILRPVATTLGGVAISPDDKWIAFESLESTNAASPEGRIMVARASVTPIAKDSWIEVASAGSLPRWSPDGRSLYFLSRSDGWSCVWGARFDSTTGKLLHAASPFMHVHGQNRPLLGSYAVSSKHLFVGLHQRAGNVWMSGADVH
jgi:Tol biopolymer transport system component